MFTVPTRLGISEIHGVGCFSTQDIPKGSVVWQLDPVFDLSFADDDVAAMSPVSRAFLSIYGYGQEEAGRRYIVLCGDHARHMNHSDQPNVVEAGDGSTINLAARDIAAGEELTCNYWDFDLDARDKLAR